MHRQFYLLVFRVTRQKDVFLIDLTRNYSLNLVFLQSNTQEQWRVKID